MRIEIISIGDELLIGQVVNTNATWLADKLSCSGFVINKITAISDSYESIYNTLSLCSEAITIITGGLGPTSDDKTREVISDFFRTPLIFDQGVYDNIAAFFAERGIGVSELNRMQAYVPESAKLLKNNAGTAPGLWLEREGKIFIFLPGVPFEMKHIYNKGVAPELILLKGSEIVLHKTILTEGIGESFLAELLIEWEQSLPEELMIAYLPQPGIVRIRLSAKGNNKDEVVALLDKHFNKLKEKILYYVIGYDDDTIESVCGRILKEKNLNISTAESCTGGYISHLLTSVSGSSAYYKGSVIAYSNEVKINVLGVSEEMINKYGAVSREVAEAMAEGVRRLTQTDFGIAVTGVAGPSGGTKEKPVGLVWISISGEAGTESKSHLFGHDRMINIIKTAAATLGILFRKINN